MEYDTITSMRNVVYVAYPAAIGFLFFISIVSCGVQRRGYEVLKSIRDRVNNLEVEVHRHRAEHTQAHPQMQMQLPRFQPIYSVPFPNPSATAPQIPGDPVAPRYEGNVMGAQYKIV